MKKLLVVALLIPLALITQGQGIKQGSLILLKEHSVTVQQGYKSPCRNIPLIRQLSDSLVKEGFQLIDSAKAMSKLTAFFSHTFGYSQRHNYTKSIDEVKAYTDREFASAKLYQQLAVYDYSCVDSVQNYLITLYMAPRGNEMVSQNFTISKNSPYSIASIVLSLIKRE